MPYLKKAELIEGIVYMPFTYANRFSWQTPRSNYGMVRGLLDSNARC